MTGHILVLNCGSSSLKFSLHKADASLSREYVGKVEAVGSRTHLEVHDGAGDALSDVRADHPFEPESAIADVTEWLHDAGLLEAVVVVGHRVVHGGEEFHQAVRIDADSLARLQDLGHLAPLHQPANLAGVNAIRERLGEVAQVACFDTAFHRSQDEVMQRYAIPSRYWSAGVRRYGFHGLSYASILAQVPEFLGDAGDGRLVILHLGSGASACAVHHGRSVTSSMGFTALDGLVMGTRCGQLDPGVVLYLMQEFDLTHAAVTNMLYRESGLLGLSGLSADMRDLLASDQPAAELAVESFIHSVCHHVGALAAALQGLDALIFTGGIGEYQPETRWRICKRLAWLGVELDRQANADSESRLDSGQGAVSVWCLPSDENQEIARQALQVVAPGPTSNR